MLRSSRSVQYMQMWVAIPTKQKPRLTYVKIFGFKYTMKHTTIDLDPNEQTAARYRLYSRAIRIVGLAQISALQPYLQARMQETLYKHIDARGSTDGRAILVDIPSCIR